MESYYRRLIEFEWKVDIEEGYCSLLWIFRPCVTKLTEMMMSRLCTKVLCRNKGTSWEAIVNNHLGSKIVCLRKEVIIEKELFGLYMVEKTLGQLDICRYSSLLFSKSHDSSLSPNFSRFLPQQHSISSFGHQVARRFDTQPEGCNVFLCRVFPYAASDSTSGLQWQVIRSLGQFIPNLCKLR